MKEKIMGATTLKLTSAMKRGQDLEEPISEVVSKKLNVKIQKVGIQLYPEYPEFGASPDGLCDEAVKEIKSPSNEKPLNITYQIRTLCSVNLILKSSYK